MLNIERHDVAPRPETDSDSENEGKESHGIRQRALAATQGHVALLKYSTLFLKSREWRRKKGDERPEARHMETTVEHSPLFKFYDMIQGEGDESHIVDVEEIHSDFGVENRN